jgi:hypothetical protein
VDLQVKIFTGDCNAVATTTDEKTRTVNVSGADTRAPGLCTDLGVVMMLQARFTPAATGAYTVNGGPSPITVQVTD